MGEFFWVVKGLYCPTYFAKSKVKVKRQKLRVMVP